MTILTGQANLPSLCTLLTFPSAKTLTSISWLVTDTAIDEPMQTLARRGSAALIGLLVNSALAFGFSLVVTHQLRPKDAGALFEALAIFMIASSSAILGADVGLVRFMPAFSMTRPNDTRRLLIVALLPSVLASTIAGALLYALASPLAHVFLKGSEALGTSHVLRVLALFIPMMSCTTIVLAGTRAWSIRPFVSIGYILLPVLRLVLLGIFTIAGATLFRSAVAWATPLSLALLLSIKSFVTQTQRGRSRSGWRSFFFRDHDIAISFWRFSLTRSLATVFEVLLQWFDVLLVGAIAGVSSAAAYAIVSRYVVLGMFPSAAVAFAIAPQASGLLHQNRRNDATALYRGSTHWIMIVGYPVMLALATYSPLFLLPFGRHYQIGATALSIIAAAMLVSLGTGNNGVMLLMGGGSAANLFVSATSLALNIVGNLLLIPHLGLTGAAVSWAIAILTTNVLTSILLWVRLKMHPFGRDFAYVAS